MKRQEKIEIIENLAGELESSVCFFVINSQGLKVGDINIFRKKCYDKGIKYRIVKNTLIKKAITKLNASDSYTNFADEVCKGSSGLMLLDNICSTPAKIISEFRKEKSSDLPVLKGAVVDGEFYFGDTSLVALSKLKSKNELVAEVISLLNSPVKNLISSLKSGQNSLSGVLKTLSKKES